MKSPLISAMSLLVVEVPVSLNKARAWQGLPLTEVRPGLVPLTFAKEDAAMGELSGLSVPVVARCEEVFGRVDILHNNVGVLAVGGPEELSEEIWDRHMAINVKGVFLGCKYCLPIMVKQGKGSIVNTSSIASIRYTGYPSAVYNASKGAVNQLTQNIAVQYGSKGIRANCVLPGLMNTPMIREPLKDAYGAGGMDEMIRRRDAQVPMGKMGDAWDVAYASLFLASDEAKYITGALLVVDGGLTCKVS